MQHRFPICRLPPRGRAVLTATLAAWLAGCGARSELETPAPAHTTTTTTSTTTTTTTSSTSTTTTTTTTTVPCEHGPAIVLSGTIRDFHTSHPDFEKFLGDDPGIVADQLGADGEPVYAGNPTTPTTTGKANFDQWYHDSPGVNEPTPFALPLTGDLASFSFTSDEFFPIDDKLFGNEGLPHNYAFTLELHGNFRYQGGETFDIAGDDDVWVFVNKTLVVDLGGVHSTEEGNIDVTPLASSLGLVQDQVYPLDVFFAERHTSGSTLHVTLSGPDLCIVGP